MKIISKTFKNQIKVSIVRCFAFAGKHILENQILFWEIIYSIINKKSLTLKSEYKSFKNLYAW